MLLDSPLMRLDAFDYHLPPGQIAQRPLERRDASRLLELPRSKGSLSDHLFADLPNLLRGDELIVLNNTRVIPARLFGLRAGVHSQHPSRTTRHEHLTGKVEVFLTRQVDSQIWEALVRPGRKMQTGERVLFGEGELEAEVISRGELGVRTLRFVSRDTRAVSEHLERLGHVPLPPYIHRTDEDSDRERYQTVFAKQPGAIAAPTAGLHFTPKILEMIRARGVEICELTLDVGLGTFQPVHAETLSKLCKAFCRRVPHGAQFLLLAPPWFALSKPQPFAQQNPAPQNCYSPAKPTPDCSFILDFISAWLTPYSRISTCRALPCSLSSARLLAARMFSRPTTMLFKQATASTVMETAC